MRRRAAKDNRLGVILAYGSSELYMETMNSHPDQHACESLCILRSRDGSPVLEDVVFRALEFVSITPKRCRLKERT